MIDVPQCVREWAEHHPHPRYREWLTEDSPDREARVRKLCELAGAKPIETRRGKPVVALGTKAKR